MARSRTLNFILAADARQVTRAFGQADKAATKTAKTTEHAHGRMGKAWHSTAGNAFKAAAGVTAAYVSISKAHDAIAATEELAKTTQGLHRNLGLSVQQASRWGAVAKARDIDSKALTMSFTALSRQVTAANDGGDKQQKIFAKLGLTQKDLHRGTHDFSGLVTQLADGFGKLHGGTERQAAAQALLGRGYQSVLPLFAEGSKSLREQLHWADEYGVTLNDKTIKPLNDLIKSQRELKVANLGLKAQFTNLVAPGLLEVEHAAERVMKVLNDPKLTGEQKWEKVGNIVGPIADKIGEGVTAAIPKIAEGVGEHAPMVASAFVKGFANSNVWGKLAIGGFLISKMGGLGAFSALGGSGGGAAAKGFGARFRSGLRGALKGVGIASVINGAITAATQGGRGSDRLQNFFSGATFGLVPQAGLTRLRQTTEILKVFNARVGNFDPAKIHNAAGQLRKLADTKLGHDWFDHGKLIKAAEDLDHLGQRSQILRDNIGRMKKGGVTDIRELRKVFANNLNDIRDIMGTRSKRGAQMMARNTDAAIGTIKNLMGDGVHVTRKGMAQIERIFEQEARAFGISPKAARESAHVKAYDVKYGGSGDFGGVGTRGRATGGFIGSPGEAGGDNIPIVVGRGEAVLNRYQQAPVEMALRSTYGMGLDDLFAQVNRPHYMARGGKVKGYATGGLAGVKPGVRKAASSVLSRFPGLVVTSTTGGGHAPGSFHYKGEAVDVSGDPSTMYRASQWIKSSGLYRGLAEGIHNPNLAVKYGKLYRGAGPFSGVWGNHSNHIHIAVAGALKAAGFSAAQIKRILVSGPPSYVKTIAQGALDTARKAGNARLSSLSASAGGGDLAGAGITGGGGNRANMALGRRLLHSFGYGDNQWPALRSLWTRESGWRTTATNPSSGAYGIPQSLPGSKMASAGSDWRTNPATQIRWGLGYIRGRYGSPRGALAHENSYGWYARGGRVPHARSGRPQPRSHHGARIRPHRTSHLGGTNWGALGAPTLGTGEETSTLAGSTPFKGGPAGGRQTVVVGIPFSNDSVDVADSTDALAQAIQDDIASREAQTQALKDLQSAIDTQNKFAEAATAQGAAAALKALADVLSGNLGPRVQQRIQSPSFGAVARA